MSDKNIIIFLRHIFVSHLITMLIYSIIVSYLISLIRFDNNKLIIKNFIKLFVFMFFGVIVFSWFMYLF